MEGNIITQVFLPLALFIIMLGMGLALAPADFKRIFIYPKAVALGVAIKVLLIPVLAFGFLQLFPMQPELAVGVILIAACPGGATSNLITHLARGNVALSITLTAISSMLTVFTIPLFVSIALGMYLGESSQFTLPFFETVVKILLITILPVIVGMYINYRAPKFSVKAQKPVKLLSAVFLVLIIFAALAKEWDALPDLFAKAGPIALALNITALAIGYLLGYFMNLEKEQNVTLSIETGIVNGTLGIAIAAGILENSVMTIPSAVYSIIMFPMVGFMIYYGNKNAGEKPTPNQVTQ